VIGYSATQFYPAYAGLAWMGLITIGGVSSWVVGMRNQSSIQSENGRRIGVFWLILFGYAAVWLLLLHPAKLPQGAEWAHYQPINDRQISAFFATVPMFAYVVGGLWFGRFFVWLGAVVTAMTLFGFYCLPQWFQLWMALTGGGSLIAAGLYIRKSWR
jgi:hypothetical protein